jgi:hypothetical protein
MHGKSKQLPKAEKPLRGLMIVMKEKGCRDAKGQPPTGCLPLLRFGRWLYWLWRA